MKLTGSNSVLSAKHRLKQCTGALVLAAVGLLSWAVTNVANAQALSTTTVQGTVYLANGKPGAGTLNVSWPGFTTANGQTVVADNINVTIPSDGFVSVNLPPNLGATPAGLYYTAVFYMSDGTVNTQYWVVPSAAQATLAQVQAQVMPAAQAVQAVSKAYVDQSIAEVAQGTLTAFGGTLSGPLYLNADPTQSLQAATKEYVDDAAAAALPKAGGAMTGPVTAPVVNGVYVVDGVTYSSVNAALTACEQSSSSSCTIDARGGLGSHALGTIQPTTPTTILLGPFQDYTANQIVLVSGFHLIGASEGFSTTITSSSTTNQALLTATQTTIGSNQYVTGVVVQDIAFNPAPGATTQDGMFLDMSNPNNSVVDCFEYSTFQDLSFGTFPGVSIHLRSDDNGGHVVQFTNFYNVNAFRASSATSQSLRIEGDIGQVHFYSGQIEAWDWSDNGTNIYIGEYNGGSRNPYSISFANTSMQGGAVIAQFNGANNITFQGTHHEGISGHTNGFLFTLGGSQNYDILFEGITMAANIANGPYTNPGPGCSADTSTTQGFVFDTYCSGTENEIVVRDSYLPANSGVQVLVNNSNTPMQSDIFRDNTYSGTPITSHGTPVLQLQSSSTIGLGVPEQYYILGTQTISTINGINMPGQRVTFIAGQDGVNFSGSGNINLPQQSSITLRDWQSASFMYNDITAKWDLISSTGNVLGGVSGLLAGADSGNYNRLTLNGNLTDLQDIGITGGGTSGDSNLYLDAPSSGKVILRPNGSATAAVTVSSSRTTIPSLAGPGVVQADSSGDLSTSSALANGTTSTTQTAGDNSIKIATTAYVASPGAIAPASVAVNGGSAMTGNQGTDAYVQHSDGTGTSGYSASYNLDGSLTKGPFDFGVCGSDMLTLFCTTPDSETSVLIDAGYDGLHFITNNAADTMNQGFSSDWIGGGTSISDESGTGISIEEVPFTGEPLTGGISLQIGSTSDTGAISLDTAGTGPINLGANTINNYIANTYLLKLGSTTKLIDYGVTTAGTLTLLNPAIGSATATTQTSNDVSSYVATDSFVHGAITAALPASASLITTNSSSQAAAATAHNESTPRLCTTTNGGNAYSCTTAPTFTPAAGDSILIKFNAANTGSATLAVNGATAATIKKWGTSSNLAANDVLSGHWISATFDGTYWQLEGQLGNANATQVNAATIPASVGCVATNSSSQFVACSASTGIITGGNDTTRTTATTMTNNWTTTGLVLPTVPVGTTKSGRCVIYWQMSSTSYSATFGIGMSNSPTGLWGGTTVTYAAAGTTNWLAFSQTATTATAISTGAIAGAISTTYKAEVDLVLQTGASNPVAVTLYGTTSNSGATLTIEPGSTCYWLP